MNLQSCMGGWCTKRQHCPHYHAEDRREPEERLCIPGEDGVGLTQPIRLHRPAGTWERADGSQLAAPGPWEALA